MLKNVEKNWLIHILRNSITQKLHLWEKNPVIMALKHNMKEELFTSNPSQLTVKRIHSTNVTTVHLRDEVNLGSTLGFKVPLHI